jgi:hypothetical protein
MKPYQLTLKQLSAPSSKPFHFRVLDDNHLSAGEYFFCDEIYLLSWHLFSASRFVTVLRFPVILLQVSWSLSRSASACKWTSDIYTLHIVRLHLHSFYDNSRFFGAVLSVPVISMPPSKLCTPTLIHTDTSRANSLFRDYP